MLGLTRPGNLSSRHAVRGGAICTMSAFKSSFSTVSETWFAAIHLQIAGKQNGQAPLTKDPVYHVMRRFRPARPHGRHPARSGRLTR